LWIFCILNTLDGPAQPFFRGHVTRRQGGEGEEVAAPLSRCQHPQESCSGNLLVEPVVRQGKRLGAVAGIIHRLTTGRDEPLV
jgi:hypothetical protein